MLYEKLLYLYDHDGTLGQILCKKLQKINMSEWYAVFRVTKVGSFSQASLYNILGDKSPHPTPSTHRRLIERSNTARNNSISSSSVCFLLTRSSIRRVFFKVKIHYLKILKKLLLDVLLKRPIESY